MKLERSEGNKWGEGSEGGYQRGSTENHFSVLGNNSVYSSCLLKRRLSYWASISSTSGPSPQHCRLAESQERWLYEGEPGSKNHRTRKQCMGCSQAKHPQHQLHVCAETYTSDLTATAEPETLAPQLSLPSI